MLGGEADYTYIKIHRQPYYNNKFKISRRKLWFFEGSTNFLKQSNLISLSLSLSLFFSHYDPTWSITNFQGISQSFKVKSRKLHKVLFLNFELILVISPERFILLPILAILEFTTTRLLRAFKWDPAAIYIVLSRMRRFVLLLYPWDLFHGHFYRPILTNW